MMHGALLFELEGVLVETLRLRAAALRFALGVDGIELPDAEALELSRGRAVRRAVAGAAYRARVSFDLVATDLAASRAEQHFLERLTAGGVLLAPGAESFVRAAQAGTRCALVTRANRQEAEVTLRLAGIDDAFECMVTLDDVAEEKPAPAAYRAAVARLEKRRTLGRKAAVALEDGGDGARAARAAGVASIVVGPAPASEAIEADGYLPSLEAATMEDVRAIAARAGASAF